MSAMFSKMTRLLIVLIITASAPLFGEHILRTQLAKGSKGDYIVTAQGKTRVLLNIYDKVGDTLMLEEITFPTTTRQPSNYATWREWVAAEAPGHTSWILYQLNTANGTMEEAYSFTRQGWLKIQQADNFLSTLVSLNFHPIPRQMRKRVGGKGGSVAARELRSIWQPKMIIDGKCIPGVAFDAWKARWPKDNSELSGKTIEVYLPNEQQNYTAYFPYWLEISGMIGKAKIRIVDSGKGMSSPKPSLQELRNRVVPVS